MPAYTYRCQACEYTHEIWHGIKSSVAIICPECRTQKLTRMIQPVSAHFKGDGWAKDGYA